MTAHITLSAADELAVVGALARSIARAATVMGAAQTWRAIAAIGKSQTEKRVGGSPTGTADAAGIGPHGETWPAWSPAYAKQRGGHHRLLQGSGAMHDSIAAASTNSSASWGYPPSIIYAATHQHGDAKRGIPARPSVGFGKDEQDAVVKEIATAIREKFV